MIHHPHPLQIFSSSSTKNHSADDSTQCMTLCIYLFHCAQTHQIHNIRTKNHQRDFNVSHTHIDHSHYHQYTRQQLLWTLWYPNIYHSLIYRHLFHTKTAKSIPTITHYRNRYHPRQKSPRTSTEHPKTTHTDCFHTKTHS